MHGAVHHAEVGLGIAQLHLERVRDLTRGDQARERFVLCEFLLEVLVGQRLGLVVDTFDTL